MAKRAARSPRKTMFRPAGNGQQSRDTRRRFEQWARNPACEANCISAVHDISMATSGELTIAEVSQVLDGTSLDPEHVITPGIFVDRVLKVT